MLHIAVYKRRVPGLSGASRRITAPILFRLILRPSLMIIEDVGLLQLSVDLVGSLFVDCDGKYTSGAASQIQTSHATVRQNTPRTRSSSSPYTPDTT